MKMAMAELLVFLLAGLTRKTDPIIEKRKSRVRSKKLIQENLEAKSKEVKALLNEG